MSTEKDVRELVIVNELSQLLGKAFTIYNKTTGEAYGLDGQAVLNIAAASISKSQSIPNDTGSTTKVPVVAAVESELAKKVSLTGNETVAGIKNFSSSPVVPVPTAAQQVANKKYVDDSIATRQVALTFGIADSNAVKINAADVSVGDYARFTASGLQGRSAAEVVSDLGAEAVANKNVAGGYAGLGADAKVLPGLLPDFVLGHVRYGGTFVGSGVITSEYASLNGQNIASVEAGDYFGYYFIANAAISVHGLSFQVGDWLISNGTAGWAKVDNTDAVTTVAGRTGAITLTKSDITDFPNKWAWEDLSGVPVTFAPSSHTHEWADLTNPPASYTPSAHVHGNISNDGKIGATADYVVVTGSGGTLTTASRAGIDSRSSFPPADHTHDNRYYTETEISNFFSGAVSVTGYNKSNWDTAHGWGNHASAGYASTTTLNNHINNTSSHLSVDERAYFNKLKQYLLFAADNTSMYSTINFYSESGVSAFGIGSGGGGGVGVDIIDDLFSVRTDAALSANQGRILKGYIDLKQPQLNGTGLVRMSGTGVTYDNTSYATTSSLSNYSLAGHAHSSLYNGNSYNSDCNALAEDYKLSYTHLITSSATNLFPISNNANAIISIATHAGGYNHQLGFSSNGSIYSRRFAAGTPGNWKTLLDSENFSYYALPSSGGNLNGFLQVNSYLRVNTASYGANKGYIYFGDGTLDRWIGYDGNNFALQNGSGGQIIWHTGNLTNTLSNGYLPYWNNDSLVNSFLFVGSSQLLEARKDQNAQSQLVVRNDTSGSGAASVLGVRSGDWTKYGNLYQFNSGYTTNGLIVENSVALLSSGNVNGLRLFTYDATDLIFGTGNAANVTIKYGGNVGIGYTDRSEKFAVNGSGYFADYIESAAYIKGYRITSRGNNGFQNDIYYGNVANPIWSFGNAASYGLSYYQGSALGSVGDAIGFHFGNIAVPPFYVTGYGAVFAQGSIQSATSIKIGANWEAIPDANGNLELRYGASGGVLKARLTTSGDILAVGGVTAFAI